MEYFVFGFIAGIVTAALAAGKDRNVVGWFFIGFLLPLIGLILIIVLPKGESGLVDPSLDIYNPEGMPPNVGLAAVGLPASNQSALSPIEEIERLSVLRTQGVLSDAEFEDKKKILLDRIV